MSKTYSCNLNGKEVLQICNNFQILPDAIGKQIKTLLMGGGGFEQKDQKTNRPEDMVKEYNVIEIKKKIPNMSIEDLEKALGVNKEIPNIIDRKGLHSKVNVKAYVDKWLRSCGGSIDMVEECRAQLKILEVNEWLTQEYVARINI